MSQRKSIVISVILGCLLIPLLASAQPEAYSEEENPENMVRQIYKEVSSDGVILPDWDRVRSFFVEEALIVLRTSREGSTQFNLEEFIQDFKNFYQNPALENSGFKEEVLQVKSHVYHDIAFIGVIYEAKILNSERPPQKGTDFWLLALKEDGWKVVAVTNEIIPPGESLPTLFE